MRNRALRLAPDHYEAAINKGFDLALILVHAGEVEAALTEIERMLTEPCYMSMHQLKLDPLWDPIRDHPEFKTLLAKYGD